MGYPFLVQTELFKHIVFKLLSVRWRRKRKQERQHLRAFQMTLADISDKDIVCPCACLAAFKGLKQVVSRESLGFLCILRLNQGANIHCAGSSIKSQTNFGSAKHNLIAPILPFLF